MTCGDAGLSGRHAPVRVFVGHEEVLLDLLEPAPNEAPSQGLRLHFTLPAGTTAIRLVSPPRSHEVDTRRLGVAIQQIEVDGTRVALDGPEIRGGFYRLEEGGNISWRWTNGDAQVELAELGEAARLMVAVTPWSLPPPVQPQGRKVAVVCWDVGHNPVGRAHVLYRLLQRDWQPELVGPGFRRFGDGLWPPLRDEDMVLRSFPAETLTDVWTKGALLALSHRYDLVVVSKPRLPGLLLGLLLAEQSRCPLIVDDDEAEHAFMEFHGAGTAPAPSTLVTEPFGVLGTALAARLVGVADARTASSPLLQIEHGGHLVRHARDEAAPILARGEARRRLGFAEGDFVVAFAGTIRPHKGVSAVLAAIEAADDPALRLLLIGPVHDPALRARLGAQPAGRVVHLEGVRLAQLGDYLSAADLVPLLQDPSARIAQTQVPAKLSDALQHGVPVVAADVPPLRDLARRGVVDLIAPHDFPGYLKAVLSRGHSPARALAARRVFEGELGLEVNRVRLGQAIEEAFRRFNPSRSRASDALAELRRETRRAAQPTMALPALVLPRGGKQDLVFFWKQNDSGLFGRRSDMVARQLHASGRFRKILHLDLPLHMFDLGNIARAHEEGRATTGAMQAPGTIARALGLADEPGLHRSVMLTHSMDNQAMLAGMRTQAPDRFGAFVLARMREHGMTPETSVAWVCPVVWGFAALARQLGFARIVADLIDDQRTWKLDEARRAQMDAEYAATLAAADVVFTNCHGNRSRFLALRPDIHVVPNGAEFDPPAPGTAVPAMLADLPRPILGYVGNLRDRLDWDLLAEVARARPGWSIVMLGPHDNPEAIEAVGRFANVHLPGPVGYETMRACLRQFDVAIVPHRVDGMTDAMNPLKVYNYLAAGVPVVTTPVANLEDVDDLVAVAGDAAAFTAEVELALARGPAPPLAPERVKALSWEGRVAAMLRVLDGRSDAPGDEGESGQDEPLDLVGDDNGRQAERGEVGQEVLAEIGVDD